MSRIRETKYVENPDGTVRPEPDVLKWAAWFETADRCVALDESGTTWISTVFLGIDHNWGKGPPVLYESLVERDGEEATTRRYHTRQEALEGHRALVREYLKTPKGVPL